MANKIVNIDRSSLPIHADTQEYILRYRVISDDKNRTSAWSPVYRLFAPSIDQILAANGLIRFYTGETPEEQDLISQGFLGERLVDEPVFSTNNSVADGQVANVFWNSPSIFGGEGRQYDLYLKWGVFDSANNVTIYDNDYKYLKSVSIQSFSFAKPADKSAYDRVSIWVQSRTYPKKTLNSQMILSLTDKPF